MEASYQTIVELLKAGDVEFNEKPNASHEICATCPFCDKKNKFYINVADGEDSCGLWFCQVCEARGSFQALWERFSPPSEEQLVYQAFHEYAVRKLLKEDDVLEHLTNERDFTEEDIKDFGFGYVGKTWVNDLLKGKKVTREQLIEHGFIADRDGIELPVFWNHIIIPYVRNGRYDNFKGRCLDENARVKYIGLVGHDAELYGSEDLCKKGRVILTEGEFKRCYLKSNGYNAVALSGARNWRKYKETLNQVEDLWIILDSDQPTAKDPIGVGQSAALNIARELDKCHVVTIPLVDDQDKVGIDDWLHEHGNDDFERLLETSDLWKNGEKQKPQSLAIVVTDWAKKAISRDRPMGYKFGFNRLNEMWRGVQPPSLIYIIGAPHMGKTTLLRGIGISLYKHNPELIIEYNSNDDALRETMPHFVAVMGQLNAADAAEPTISYADNTKMMTRWENAVKKLEAMSSRFSIIDRSYRKSLEDIYEETMRWREKNPNGHKVLMFDGFRKLYSRKAANVEGNERLDAMIKSDQLKVIAQEAEVPVISTIEPPKLYGRRPRSFDIANSAMGEFDANVIVSCYIEAQVKGIDGTDLKQTIEYKDGFTDIVPIIEVNTHKNKQNGISELDLFILHKNTSALEELSDPDHVRYKRMVLESEMNGDRKRG